MTRGMTRAITRAGLAAVLATALLPLAGCGDAEPADPEAGELLDTVFVGDSITAGVSSETFEPDDSYSWVRYALTDGRSPWLLEDNVALFGRTLVEMQAVFEDEVLKLEPEGVVIMGGTNDALRQLPVEPSIAALRAMVVAARGAGVEVWIVSPAPLDAAYQRPIAPIVDAEAALAAELDVPFVDISQELADGDGRWVPGMSFDGVHPSREGARRIARLVLDEFGR